jgi:lipopolysaccharide export system protein LptC
MIAGRARQAWERISLYLPVVLMGLMALGTWWLVRNAPKPLRPAQVVAPTHEPDYFMRGFSVKSFDANGRLQSEIRGDIARHYPDTDTLEIDKAHMRSMAPDGRITVATANRALTNSDASEVQLFGNAVVTREPLKRPGREPLPRLQFKGEFLQAWLNSERVSSNQPVTLTRGNDQFTADHMDYDNLDQIMQMRGRVRGTLIPPAR